MIELSEGGDNISRYLEHGVCDLKPCINLLFLCMKSSVNSVMLPILSLPKSQPLEVIGQKLNNSNFWLQSGETHAVYRSDVFFNVDLGF